MDICQYTILFTRSVDIPATMMKPYTLDTGYPVYGAKFITKRTLLTTGGGGEGNNGIPNKLSGFRIDFTKEKAVQKFRELTLSANEDCPMSLDAANNVILLGVNENSSSIKQGKNNHLRKFGYVNHHLKYLDKQQLSNSRDNRDYQKFTHLSSDASVACIATSKVPTTIYVVDPQSLEKKFELETGVDVKDMHISPDGKIVCYVCANSLHGYSTVTAKLLFKDDSFKNHTLLKVKFLDQHHLLIVSSQKQGISLIHYSLAKNSIVNSRVISKKLKGVTALDTRNGVVALCGNDNSLFLIKVSNLKPIKQFNKIHKFSITSCCFNKSGDLLATVSAANTVSVMEIPKGLATKTSLPRKIFNYFLLTVFMAILAIVLQWSIENGHLQQLWQKLLNGDVIDSSRYFKVESIPDEELSAGLLESSYSSFSSEAVSVSDSISASEPAIGTAGAVTTSLSSTRRIVPETYSTATELKPEKVKLFNSHLDTKSSVDSTGSFTSLNTEGQDSSSRPHDSKKTKKVISSESSTEFETSSVSSSQSVGASFGSSSLTASSRSVTTPSVNQDSSVSGSNDPTSSTLRQKKSKKKRKTKTKTRTKTKKTTETETETVIEDDLAGITISSDIVSDISSGITNSADILSEGMPTEAIESLINAENIVDESVVENSATIDLHSERSNMEKLTMDPVQPIIEPIDEPPRGIELEDIKAENKREAIVDDTANGEEETIDDVVETSTETSTAIEPLQEKQDEAANPVGESNETVENENEAEPEEFGDEEMTVNEEQNEETVPNVDSESNEEIQKDTHNDEANGVEEVLEEAKEFLEDAKDVLDEAKAVLEGGQDVKAVPEESTILEESEPLEEGEESEEPTKKAGETEKQQIPETFSDLGTERRGETSERVVQSKTLNDEREATVKQSELDTNSDDHPEKSTNEEGIASELQDLSLDNDEDEKEEKEIDELEDEKVDDAEEYEDDENEDAEEDEEDQDEDEEDEEDGSEDEEETEEGEEEEEEDEDEDEDEHEEEHEDEDEEEEEEEEEENTNHDEL